ncbi:MAG: class I SAM-dependent methyltransferase, partial [Dongiaceae bacterium]
MAIVARRVGRYRRVMQIEWSPTAKDYARHRAGFSHAFFDRLADRGIVRPAEAPRQALDLGTGTGSLARGLARRGWQVTGMDVSEAMLAEARRLAASDGVIVQFLRGSAEATHLPDA